MAQTTRLASFGPFFIFVGLRWPSLAAVGLRGPSWASSGPKRGLYSPPRIPRRVRGQSELSEDSPRTPLGLNSDDFWLMLQPNLKFRVRI